MRWLFAIGLTACSQLGPAASTRLVAAEVSMGATLTVLADSVEVAPASGGTFSAGVAGQNLQPGDIVRTGPSGLALLTFFDGSESQLASGTEVQIEQAEYAPAPQIALLQTGGVTINRVIPLPPGGGFRTDTPEATGLVRGTSYVVSVGSSTSTAATSMVLLTDRDGHVGHVQVVSAQATAPTVDLVRAGDARGWSGEAKQVESGTLAQLESAAQDLRDVDSARAAHEQVRRGLHTDDAGRASAPIPADGEPRPMGTVSLKVPVLPSAPDGSISSELPTTAPGNTISKPNKSTDQGQSGNDDNQPGGSNTQSSDSHPAGSSSHSTDSHAGAHSQAKQND